jgi:hypothetical protein
VQLIYANKQKKKPPIIVTHACNPSYARVRDRRITSKAGLGKSSRLSEKKNKTKKARGVVQVVEHFA